MNILQLRLRCKKNVYDSVFILLEIALTILLAKTLGCLFERVKQPAVIGERLTGIVLDPYLLGKFSDTTTSLWNNELYEFEALTMLDIITLLFLSGLETKIR